MAFYLSPMKKWLLFAALFVSAASFAQDSSKPKAISYKTFSSFPAFPLLKTDSTKFNSVSVVEKNHPTVIIYFSPTCSHCQHQAEEITASMKQFEGVNFLFVSSYTMEDINQYVSAYGLNHFSNITVGQDAPFNMGRFFELKSLPGIFVYDKKGKLTASFDTNLKADVLAKAIGIN